MQRPDGRWLDFRGDGFISSPWVTAYVGRCLADARGSPESIGRALRWLLCHQHPGGGWGFSLANPPDADSIANVVHLLAKRELGPWDAELAQATELLLRYWVEPEGGFQTYRVMPGDPLHGAASAWCDVHLSVTALAGQALFAADRRRHAAVLSACAARVRRWQTPDGFWEDYWWDGRTYGTYHAARFLHLLGDPEPAATAAAWLVSARDKSGAWGSCDGGEAAAFHTALAVGTLLLSGRQRDAGPIQQGVLWLVRAQLPDGSWPSVPIMRVPMPEVRAPWEDTEGRSIVPLLADKNRLFTTATVLSVLAEYCGPRSI